MQSWGIEIPIFTTKEIKDPKEKSLKMEKSIKWNQTEETFDIYWNACDCVQKIARKFFKLKTVQMLKIPLQCIVNLRQE